MDLSMPDAAEKLINNWVTGVLQTNLKPMKKVARMLHSHRRAIEYLFTPALTGRPDLSP
ncbi:hypothetical protein [Nitrosomonas nitrosa]|uniref:hypothetical protein n=1 Tax=Nitrosomonas nitrosa TaxID=52442 RepID=UPI003C6DF639